MGTDNKNENVFEEVENSENKNDTSKENTSGKKEKNKQDTKPVITDAAKAKQVLKKRKRKKIIKALIIVAVILAVLLFAAHKLGMFKAFFGSTIDMSNTYKTYTVSYGSVTKILESSGTLQPNDERTITSLVNGEIMTDYIEEGDSVIEDEPLYEIDSENLDSSVTRASNALKNAQKNLENALENREKLSVKSDFSGTIQKMYVEIGDEVNAGEVIADVSDKNTMCVDIPFLSADCVNIKVGDKATLTFDAFSYDTIDGTVTEISATENPGATGKTKNVTISVTNPGAITLGTTAKATINGIACTKSGSFYYNDEGKIYAKISGEVQRIIFDEGDFINKDTVVVQLVSEDLEDQIEAFENNVEDAQSLLDDANDSYDNYKITAPITGKVVIKNYKTGDTISTGSGATGINSLAKIYDMSALKFDMSIDEIDIDSLSLGQDVIITCDSREGKEYHGTVTYIDYYNYTNTSGTTAYPVEVTIENEEDLSLRKVDEDGTIHKVYKTGMTGTEKTYSLISIEETPEGIIYTYGDDMKIVSKNGEYYHNGNLLRDYIDGSYTYHNSFFNFSEDLNTLVVEVQNESTMLKCGMNVDAKIIVQQKSDVLVVPNSAVARNNVVKVIKSGAEKTDAPAKDNTGKNNANKNNNGKNSAYGTTPADTEYEEVVVSIGISDENFAEVLTGLKEGDVIIVQDNAGTGSLQNFGAFAMGGMPGGGGMPSGGGIPAGNAGAAGGGNRAGGTGR